MLENTSWLDAESKAAAVKKANEMVFQISYPNELDDDKVLEDYYSSLELQPNSLLHSVLRIANFNGDHAMSRFHVPFNKTYWGDFAGIVNKANAMYIVNANIIRMFFAMEIVIEIKIDYCLNTCSLFSISSCNPSKTSFLG